MRRKTNPFCEIQTLEYNSPKEKSKKQNEKERKKVLIEGYGGTYTFIRRNFKITQMIKIDILIKQCFWKHTWKSCILSFLQILLRMKTLLSKEFCFPAHYEEILNCNSELYTLGCRTFL